MISRLRAHRWHVTGMVALALILSSILGRSIQISLPMTPFPVPVFTVVTVGTMVLMVFPLMSSVPDFERALLREQKLRVVRVVAVIAGASTVVAIARAVSEPVLAVMFQQNFPLLIILGIVGVVAIVVVGDVAWLVVGILGFLSLLVQGAIDNPLDRALSGMSLPVLVPLVVAAAALYVWRGPRLPV